uniref:Polycystin cation channel PKD1/PKD2 domain-containing protein n=1 Tax=Chromera velia CCMP2878 TaxID=1169474 RepID=A0A0G4IDD9_9ALVE|eukprot:Cvel_13375.t1-p1 / transcript=Cvel_13375.t1 / gene=Cvel_13375 / organism=Chromera_velia_CCMP2878 / gene_product=hypothetical protein / transcript_product=hypothetical protein / location=Cvel_scaffold910:5473-27398(+) / protein_length=1758 / sequence_SO=supercontig / SO=protein_coding / is_pseudo=false
MGLFYGAHEGLQVATLTSAGRAFAQQNNLTSSLPAGKGATIYNKTLTGSLTDGNWHHLTVVVENETSTFFVDSIKAEKWPNPTHAWVTGLSESESLSSDSVPSGGISYRRISDCAKGTAFVATLPLVDLIHGGGALAAKTAETDKLNNQVLDTYYLLTSYMETIFKDIREQVTRVNAQIMSSQVEVTAIKTHLGARRRLEGEEFSTIEESAKVHPASRHRLPPTPNAEKHKSRSKAHRRGNMTTQKSNGGKGEKRAFGLKHEAAEEKGQKESSETARRLVDGPSQSSELCRPSGYAVTFQSPYVRDCTASETAQGLVNIKFTWTMTNGHPDQTAFQTLFNPGNTGNGEWQDSTTGDKLGTVLIEAIKGMLFSAGTYGSTNSAAMKTAMGNNGVMFSPTSTTRFSVDTEFSESYPPGQYEATVTIQVFHDTATGQAEATSLEIGQRLVNYGGALLSKDVGCFRPRGNNADSNGLTAADCASQYTDALTTATYGSGPTDVERYIGQIFSPTYNQYLAVTLYDYETITLLCNGVQADAFTPVAADKLTNNLFDAMYGACRSVAYQTRLFAVFDSKRYVCTQDTGTSTWSWELKSDGFIEFAEAGFFRGIEEAKGNAWTMDQWMTVLSDSSNLALSTTNAQLGMLVSSDMTSSTAAQTYVTTGVTTLANTYGFGGRRALEEGDSGEGEWVVDGSHQESGKKEKRKRKLDDNQYSIVMGQVLENNFVNGNPKAEVYDFQFWSRGLSQGEAQELYYQGIKAGIGGLVGAKEDPLASRETSVKLYERETSYNCTFPDLLQLNESMREFVPADTANKTNFACVNREAEELIQHWDRSPNELQGNKLFTEITHMFDYAVVFRDNKIQSTTEWVDLKTNEVTLWQLFYTPGKQIGTKLEITFELSEEGVSHKTTDITSIQRNPGDRYAMLMVFGAFCIFFAVLHLIYGILSYLCGLEKDPTRPGRLRQSTLFADPLPLVIFDTILRSCIAGIMLLILVLEYEKQEKVFNETLKAVVEVPWTSEQVAFSDKFTQFFTALGAMLQVYYVKNILDMLVVSVIFLCLVRICMYLSVHPRIAILVDTVKTSLDDLFHFFITFAGLYLLFAFMAFYSYGDVIKEFASFGQACYTQFRMVLGDWAFPVDRGDAFLYIYMVAFALVIFFILLNFFLAIIIDAYAEVKKHVEDSLVEKNLMVDMWDLAAYSMLASRQRLVKNTREEVLKQLARVKTDEIPWVSRYELRKMNSVFGKSKKRFFSWRRGAKSKSTHGVNSDEGLGTKNIYKRFSAVGFMTEDALGWIPSVNARADAFFDFYSNRHPSLQEPYGDLDKDEKKPKVQDEEESDDENGIEQWLGLGGRIMKQPEAISDDPKVMARDIRSLRETCCAQTEQLDQLSRFLLGDAYQSTNLNQLRGSIAMITKSKSKFMKKISSDQAGHPNAILTEEEAETQHEESSSYMHKDSFGVLTFGSMGSKTQKETTHATAPITITDADDKHKGSKDKAAEELGALDELISSMGGDPPKEGEELSQNTESLGRGSVGGEREEEPTQAAASSAHVQEQRPTSVHRVEAPSEESEAYIFPSLQQTGANVSLGTLGGRHSRAGSVNSARSSVPETAGLLATRNTRESLKQGGGRGGAGRGLSGGSAAARAGKAIVGDLFTVDTLWAREEAERRTRAAEEARETAEAWRIFYARQAEKKRQKEERKRQEEERKLRVEAEMRHETRRLHMERLRREEKWFLMALWDSFARTLSGEEDWDVGEIPEEEGVNISRAH